MFSVINLIDIILLIIYNTKRYLGVFKIYLLYVCLA